VLKAPTYFDLGDVVPLAIAWPRDEKYLEDTVLPARSLLDVVMRKAVSFLAAFAITVSAAEVSTAQDLGTLRRDLASPGSDFRLRVGAALALGKTHDKSAIAPLVAALDDAIPAVRASAAAALGVLGHREAADALHAHLARESSPNVRAQIEAAIAKLEARAEASARVLVKLGELKNLSGSRGERLTAAFRGATRAKAALLPGVELVSDGSEGRSEAALRKLPLLILDGVLNHLSQGSEGQQMMVSARVEYVFRKMPEHALTGSVSGTARALDTPTAFADQGRLAQLEVQALEGAIESAMRGAPDVMKHALR
jgi:hypothetical protein